MPFVMSGYLSVCMAEFHIWVTDIHARTRPPEANLTEHVSPLGSLESWRALCGPIDHGPGIRVNLTEISHGERIKGTSGSHV